ncbi:MAG: hypothetical protein WAX07_05325 [Candidatus Altiarchaeia archaeon]
MDEPYPPFLWLPHRPFQPFQPPLSVLPSSTTMTLSAYFFDLSTMEPMPVSSFMQE